MSGFATTLNFTSANEDGASELAALALQPADHVLCLTASGARPLDLLLGNPANITATDINPVQNELLRLKIAAFRALDYQDLLAWLGITQTPQRLHLHSKVEALLPPASHAFWQTRRRAIAAGIWHSGRWERVLWLGAAGTQMIRGRRIDALFGAPTLEDQTCIWRDHFDDAAWHSAVRLLSRRWFWTRIIGEPGGAFLPDPAASEARLTGLFRRAAESFFFRESDFATLIFRGRHTAGGALPLHLQPQNFETIRTRLDRIRIAAAGLADLGASGLGPFDAFSLSDFGSYCSGVAYDACWRGILAAASPGARFCERIFMNPVRPGPALAPHIRIDDALSAALTRSDRAIIYDIRAGTLQPA